MASIIPHTPDSPRRALLLDLSANETLLDSLQLNDWLFDRATSVDEAQAMLRQQTYRVGVALLTGNMAERY